MASTRAAAVLLAAGLLAAVLQSVRRPTVAPPAAQTSLAPLPATTSLPPWRAVGVPLHISGFAAGYASVRLLINGKPVDRTTSGKLGHYVLTFPAAHAGRFRLTVTDGRRSRLVGSLSVRPVVLNAVGDITFGEQVGSVLATRGARYPWIFVASQLRSADITTGNLETSVSRRGAPASKEFTFRGLPSDLTPLSRFAGFDVLTLANNHTVDYGRDALLDTVRYVHDAGIQTIGAGANEWQARRPAIVEAGGLRVALLGYSDVNPTGFVATATLPGTARANVGAIRQDVRAALRRADVAVCFFHWGVELRPNPDARQEMFADACIQAGAKLVIGAHPHVLGPTNRPTPSSLIAWTLGNFVFPSSGKPARTAILEVALTRAGVRSYRLLPVTIEGFRPVPAAG
jgi:poly-gamma-glutamate capsule biosynthesis protein CapA/YwtB (metallophosphatase superfamily)